MHGGRALARLDLLGDRLRLVDRDGEGLDGGLAGLDWNWVPLEAAVFMPITWPEELTSAPPESPGWMSALGSISPVSCSLCPTPRPRR